MEIPNEMITTLVKKASEVSKEAGCHISSYRVGAAILGESGNIYTGCNIEFDNFTNTIHAEESAISAFVTAGEKKPLAIAVFTWGDDVEFPCGMCRQSLYEIGGNELEVIACNDDKIVKKTMAELLPNGFRLKR